MDDRYRYPRPRSPTMYNPARASLPISISHPSHEHRLHAIPASRHESIAAPRSSNSSASTTTTYKIMADPPSRSSSIRDSSRRRSTLDSNNRPAVIPTIVASPPHRHRSAVVHSGGGRPASPLKNPYRSSEEEYYAIPASSRHGSHHRPKSYSATMDNGDMHRLERERDGNRLRIAPGREERIYTGTRSRTIHPGSLVRYDDNIAVDYGDNGYGYTNPQDLVRYDLNNNVQPRHRKDSFEGCRTSRPSSITGYNDLPPKVYDSRDKGPPLSTRGWDRIPGNRASTWEQSQVRMPVPVPGPGQGQGPPPMAPIERPARMDPPFDGEPQRRSSAHRLERPVLHYHDKEPRRPHREEYYETRDEDLRDRRERPHRHERYDDPVEQRGFGLRPERPERPERPDRQERSPPLRSERDRADRPDEDRSEHKHGREALATGLSVASAAFGINAMKRSRDDDRDDRDERDERDDRRRRDYGEEPRRRRDPRDDREPIDFSGRDPKERHASRDERNIPPPPRDIPPPPRDRDLKDRDATEPPFIDLSGRDPKERHASRDERDSDSDHREHRRRSEIPPNAVDSRDESSVSDDGARRSRRVKAEPGVAQAKFNPKDAMDLKALKEALTSKDVPKEPIPAAARTPRESTTKDPKEVAEIRTDLRGREPLAPNDNRQLRVVSPPRDKSNEDKPVKGILRKPREQFPEDPSPIREGVAPLKDAKKDGVPPDARWTKISRKLVNPAALEAGKERFETREDFVIVLRVLSRDEVQGYAEVTQKIRAAREEIEEAEASAERRRARRERHERHKRERSGEIPRPEPPERSSHRRHRERGERIRERERESHSESDSTDDDSYEGERPKMLEPAPKAVMSGGLGDAGVAQAGLGGMGSLRENPDVPGQYIGYTRNPPPPTSLAATVGSGRKDSGR